MIVAESNEEKRRICWPPDATCLEGGCGYCAYRRLRLVSSIRKWAESAGQVPNRNGGKTQDALVAFTWGQQYNDGPGKSNKKLPE